MLLFNDEHNHDFKLEIDVYSLLKMCKMCIPLYLRYLNSLKDLDFWVFSYHHPNYTPLLCFQRAMMMTGCDLSAITKPWEVQSKVGTFRTGNSLSVLLPIWCMII